MSTILSVPAAAHSITTQSWPGALAGALKRWWMAYMSWRIQQHAMAELGSMSDRELKDIGLTRSQIAGAVSGEAARDRAFSRYY